MSDENASNATLSLDTCTIDLTARTADFPLYCVESNGAEGSRVVDITSVFDVLGHDLTAALDNGAARPGEPLSKEYSDHQLACDDAIDPVDGDLSLHFDTTATDGKPARSVVVYVSDARERADVTSVVLGADDKGRLVISDSVNHLDVQSSDDDSSEEDSDTISDDELLLDLWIELIARLQCAQL